MISVDNVISGLETDIYIKTLVAIAKVDGLTDEEKNFVDFQAGVVGIEGQEYWSEETDISSICFDEVSAITKKIILRDSIVITHIDKIYSDTEKVMINNLAHQMNLPESFIDELEDWLLAYWAHLELGNTLLGIDE